MPDFFQNTAFFTALGKILVTQYVKVRFGSNFQSAAGTQRKRLPTSFKALELPTVVGGQAPNISSNIYIIQTDINTIRER